MRTSPILASFVASLFFSQAALAQTPPPLPPPAPVATAPAPDIVKLKDGSLFRGTIAELVAGDHVDILLMNGETKRFPMAQVAYAGSAQAAAPAAPPSAPPARGPAQLGDRAELKVEANEENVEFHVKTGEANVEGFAWTGGRYGGFGTFSGIASAYSTLCIAPCKTSMPVGTHRVGLSMGTNGRVIEPDEPVVISGSGTLHGEYESRVGLRIAGVVTIVVADLAGLGMMLASISNRADDCSYGVCTKGSPDSGLLYGGMGVMLAGTIVGLVLLYQHDHATVTFVPGTPAALSGRGMETLGVASADPRGGMLRVSF